MQFQADLLGVPVIRPKVAETTALGAAYAAGLATGLLVPSRRTCARTGTRTSAGSPRWTPAKRDEYYKYWKKAVTRTFDWFESDEDTRRTGRRARARHPAVQTGRA